MYVLLVHPHPQPEWAAEYARRWEVILAPKAQAMPGFRAAYFVGNRETEALHAIYVFDEPPGAAFDEAMDDFRQQCRDITTGPAQREGFEVLAEA
jgi:hypothetical protein